MIRGLILAVSLCAGPATADGLIAARTIAPGTLIAASDIRVTGDGDIPATIIGLEARVAIYAGRPIRAQDLGPPALVERNDIVALIFQRGALVIRSEGRALDRGGSGDRIRLLNMSSRQMIVGEIQADGAVYVRGAS